MSVVIFLSLFSYGLYLIAVNTPWKLGVFIYVCILLGFLAYKKLVKSEE